MLSNAAACPTDPSKKASLMGSFSLNNICVRYQNKHLAVADLISSDGNQCAALFGYNEYRQVYAQLADVRAPRDADNLASCQRHRLGLAVRFSSNNFFHQSFYAAAMHRALVGVARTSDAVFVPIGGAFPAEGPNRLWEYTLRSLSNASADQLFNDTHTLLRAPCTCFDRFIGATHGLAPMAEEARAILMAYRRSAARNARAVLNLPPVTTRAARDMLFIMRRTARRVITNEQEVLDRVLAAQPRLRVVAFEEMPVAQQMALVSESSVLIGVHGMAIAGYVVHLPADERKTACVEIQPRPDPVSWTWSKIVKGLAHGAGVRFLVMQSPHSPGCYIDTMRSMNCTGDALCQRAVSKGLRSFAASSVLNCNVTVDSAHLLTLIQSAADHTK